MDRFAQLNTYHMTKFAYFLERLKATPDGDGTLLDHSLVLYGSSLSDGNQHNFSPLPIVLAGGASGQLKGGRHLQFPKDTRMSNLLPRCSTRSVCRREVRRRHRRARDLSGDWVSRRAFIAGLGATAILPVVRPATTQAQQGNLLPLNTPKVDHLDVIVPDVAASARFYMAVFNTTLHAQPFQGGFRYFILFGDLPANRQVGYVAIGDSRGRGTYIGHFCTSVFNVSREQQGDFDRARGRGRQSWSREAVRRRWRRRDFL